MTKQRSTKRALLVSVLSLLLCISMLIGTTYAWFTDTVTSAGNKIVAGNLDVELLMWNGKDAYVDISAEEKAIFGTGSIAQNNNAETLWEPGKTQVAYLAIKNNGNLDLKYKVLLDVLNVEKNLYKVMEYAIIPNAMNGEGVDSWPGGKKAAEGLQVVAEGGEMQENEIHYFALAIHMEESAGNEYQGGEVAFDITVSATQLASEYDSFDNQYDAAAKYEGESDETTGTTDVTLRTNTVEVTAENLTAVAFTADDTNYVFKGTFDSINVRTEKSLNQTFIGTDATVTGEVRVGYSGGVAHSYANLDPANNAKSGDYEIYDFKAETVVTALYNTSVSILGNELEFIDVTSGNVDLTIADNTIDANNEAHIRFEGASNGYGLNLDIIDYTLTFTGNSVINTASHAIGINGREADGSSDFLNKGTNIIAAFTGNTLTVNSTVEGNRSALKIWADYTYAPQSSPDEVNDAAKALIKSVYENNTIKLKEGKEHNYFGIYKEEIEDVTPYL